MSLYGPKPKINTCGHPERKHIGRGMCAGCYNRYRATFQNRKRQMEGWKRSYTKEQRRKWHLKSKYKITEQSSNIILSRQNNKCAICEKPLPERTFVDHDHSCCPTDKSCGNCVRGFLCVACNTFLGIIENQPNLYKNAMEYLNNPPWKGNSLESTSSDTVDSPS